MNLKNGSVLYMAFFQIIAETESHEEGFINRNRDMARLLSYDCLGYAEKKSHFHYNGRHCVTSAGFVLQELNFNLVAIQYICIN